MAEIEAFDPEAFAAFKAGRAAGPALAPVQSAAPEIEAFDPGAFEAFKAARQGAARAAAPASFTDRIAGDGSDKQVWASDTAQQDTPLGRGLRARADEQLVGPPSAVNAAAALAMRAGNAAGLNIPRNVGAAIASIPGVGNGRGFSENYQLARDQEEALARQHPIAAGAGTVGGIGVGAFGLPAIGSVAKLGRLGQAALTGGVYGAAGEAADSKDPLSAAKMGLVGAGVGGAGAYAIDKLAPVVAPVVSRLIGRGVPFRGADGALTGEAQAALRGAGVDPDLIPPQLMAQIDASFSAKGPSAAVAREAQAAEFGIPLSRAQATLDPRAAGLEASAAAGTRGSKAQEIAQGFAARQGDAIDAARAGFQGMAARDGPVVDNPAAASEAVADRARQAFADHGFDVAAAQRAQDDALRLARGRGPDDALNAAQTAAGAIREAAAQSRQGYRDAYAAAAAVPGEFRPGAFDGLGQRARADIGDRLPIDEVVTPRAVQALGDLDGLPQRLAKPDGSGATAADIETVRRRLLAYRGGTAQNPTDRAAMDSIIRTFTERMEAAEGAGLFGPRQAAAPRDLAQDGFPGAAATPPPPDRSRPLAGLLGAPVSPRP